MNLEERVLALRQGQLDSSQLIDEYMPYITACASRVCGRPVRADQDEMAVAMTAFHEAIQTFDEGKGKFVSYAALVIRHRLVDHARGKASGNREIPFSALATDEEEEPPNYEIRDDSQRNRRDLMEEIEALGAELLAYGIAFEDLSAASPRSAKTRKVCAAAIRTLMSEPHLLDHLVVTGTLPLLFLSGAQALPRKTLERHRKYIIAAALILTHDYPFLSEYIRPVTGGHRS
jgi:RNA polymerase sigma factor